MKVPMAALRGRQTSHNISSVCPATAGGLSRRIPHSHFNCEVFLKTLADNSFIAFIPSLTPSVIVAVSWKKKKKKYRVIRANPIRTRSGFIHPLLGSNSSELLWLISIQREPTPHHPHPPQSVCVVAAAARGLFVLDTNLKHL